VCEGRIVQDHKKRELLNLTSLLNLPLNVFEEREREKEK
jgi:hypothetical protein